MGGNASSDLVLSLCFQEDKSHIVGQYVLSITYIICLVATIYHHKVVRVVKGKKKATVYFFFRIFRLPGFNRIPGISNRQLLCFLNETDMRCECQSHRLRFLKGIFT